MSYARRSARVLLVDGENRVLLFRCNVVADRPEEAQIWVTPGGGVGEGEGLHDAAVRELREETGLRVEAASLMPHVAYSEGLVGWTEGVFRDDYFFHRVDRYEVDTAGQEAFERAQINEHRWWTVAELRGTTEFIVPIELGQLLVELLVSRIPMRPRVLAWHH